MSQTYNLLDCGEFMKLEQVGPFRISRPSLTAVWDKSLSAKEWDKIDATFKRYKDGNGEWIVKNEKIKKPWDIKIDDVTFQLKLTGFGHLGIFAEQQSNWIQLKKRIDISRKSPLKVLNLFAYTGGSTLFAAAAGAQVVHLDASKSSVNWARENAKSSGLDSKPVRWIVDDVQEFISKELRRNNTYDAFILDPPSYGRGAKNEIWKIEEHLMPLLKNLRQLASEDFSFILLSSHSQGYTPQSLENQLRQVFGSINGPKKISYDSKEMLLTDSSGMNLPSGSYCFMEFN